MVVLIQQDSRSKLLTAVEATRRNSTNLTKELLSSSRTDDAARNRTSTRPTANNLPPSYMF